MTNESTNTPRSLLKGVQRELLLLLIRWFHGNENHIVHFEDEGGDIGEEVQARYEALKGAKPVAAVPRGRVVVEDGGGEEVSSIGQYEVRDGGVCRLGSCEFLRGQRFSSRSSTPAAQLTVKR